MMGKALPGPGPADVPKIQEGLGGPPAGFAKKETVWLVGFVALMLGFLAGVAFSAYKQGTVGPVAQPGGAMPDDQARARIQARIAGLVQEAVAHPDEPSHWIVLGNAYYDTQQPQNAIEAYQKALALDPDNPDVWTDMGVMYRAVGDPQQAIASFDKALAIDQGHEIAHFNKGVVLMHDLNDGPSALAAWETVLALNPQARTPGGQPLKDLVERLKAPPEK